MSQLRPALVLLAFLTLLTGGAYPLLTTLIGQWWFPWQAGGSLLTLNGETRGSALLGQAFTGRDYFHSRPSATAGTPYNALASGGSNLSVASPALTAQIAARARALQAQDPHAAGPVPVDLLTASASGLDNGVTPAAIAWQLPDVARARGLTEQQLQALVDRNTVHPWPEFLGPTYVNVTQLNMALSTLPRR